MMNSGSVIHLAKMAVARSGKILSMPPEAVAMSITSLEAVSSDVVPNVPVTDLLAHPYAHHSWINIVSIDTWRELSVAVETYRHEATPGDVVVGATTPLGARHRRLIANECFSPPDPFASCSPSWDTFQASSTLST